ncbi:MAG TPA: outer membrane lipoprotein carrier protein LolA [Gemmatimonadales bacterium]|jgi:outer membrane lipoprotein carrier protein|nr:outer membrane lipoprotein carrier protein LolA [Gemmatimonadales bacterium]
MTPALFLLLALQQDPGPALDRASATYQTIRTLSAEFTQVITNPMLGAPDTTRGKLYQMRPSRFAMRFTRPRGDRIVADGRHLWLYTPSTTPGQVIRTTIPAASTSGGPNFIGQFVERPRERYRARYVRSDSVAGRGMDVVELVPKTDDLPYSKAVVWIDRQDGLVRRVEIEETSGQQRTLVLSQLAVNRGVPGREFTFSPPAGLRVVDQ